MLRRFLGTDDDEILDHEGTSERGLQIIADLERWNRVAGWTRWHLRAIRRHWIAQRQPQPFRILDVGAGLGGLLIDIAGWAEHEGIEVDLVGIDHNEEFVKRARERLGDRAFVYHGDATSLGCGDHAYHLATCTLMMHHLEHIDRSALVAELARACRNVYLFDLALTLHGVVGATFIPRLAGLGRDASHDGLVSVRRAATYAEFCRLVEPLPVSPTRVFPSAMCTLPESMGRVRSGRMRRGRVARPVFLPVPAVSSLSARSADA
jgi:SAM-dependent methyltransferase